METLAENLRKRAKQLHLSNAEVARRVGLSERRYGNYVSGRREPDLATLLRIARNLGVTPNDLLTEKSKVKPTKESLLLDSICTAAATLDAAKLELLSIVAAALATKPKSN